MHNLLSAEKMLMRARAQHVFNAVGFNANNPTKWQFSLILLPFHIKFTFKYFDYI